MKDPNVFGKPKNLALVFLRMDSSMVTRSAIALGEVASSIRVENTRSLATDTHQTRKAVVGHSTRIGLALEVFGHRTIWPTRIEIKIDSLAGVGSTSRVVISRGVESYVTEFSFGYTESMNVDASTLGTGQPPAFLRWQTQRNTASSNKKEKDALSSCLPISKKMAQLLRHFAKHREEDEAVPWRELKTHVEGFRDKISTETFDDGKDCLKYGTDNIRFENCPDQVNRKTYLRSMQGRSERVRINPKLQNNVRNF